MPARAERTDSFQRSALISGTRLFVRACAVSGRIAVARQRITARQRAFGGIRQRRSAICGRLYPLMLLISRHVFVYTVGAAVVYLKYGIDHQYSGGKKLSDSQEYQRGGAAS